MQTPSLAEILESPESLKKADENFGKFCDAQSLKVNLSDIPEGFLKILDECGNKSDEFYKKICDIGRNEC